MIPFIRSLSELMAITESRDSRKAIIRRADIDICPEDSGQRKRYIKSMSITKVELPDLPKSIKHKWSKKKDRLSNFLKELDYNNQIQPSYDLTLQERQINNSHKEAA